MKFKKKPVKKEEKVEIVEKKEEKKAELNGSAKIAQKINDLMR